mmetsp:Transcript_37914/g.73403  ORF Transcript_37914/g.73403 Transcript_37914/m.73403 type:complete len:531 (+) Transcript_37914:35-1627(+)
MSSDTPDVFAREEEDLCRAIALSLEESKREENRRRKLENERNSINRMIETYENQRYYPLSGWNDELLPTDRYQWSTKDGKAQRRLMDVKLPEGWQWVSDWKAHVDTPGSTDNHGWEYAVDFQFDYYPAPSSGHFVRRRRWTRVMKGPRKALEVQNETTKSVDPSDVKDGRIESPNVEQEALAQEIKTYLLELGANKNKFDCPVCLCEIEPLEGLKLCCGHLICCECLKNFLTTHISQVKVMKCPHGNSCGSTVSASDARLVLSDEQWKTYVALEALHIRNETKGLFNCPTPDCPNSVFVGDMLDTNPSKKKQLQDSCRSQSQSERKKSSADSRFRWNCKACRSRWCVRCKRPWHPRVSCVDNERKNQSDTDRKLESLVKEGKMVKCLCGIYIQKDQGCKYMTCTQCRAHFCWDCKRFLRRDHEHHACVPTEAPPNLTPEEKQKWIEQRDRRKRADDFMEVCRATNRGIGFFYQGLNRYRHLQRMATFAARISSGTGVRSVGEGLRAVSDAMEGFRFVSDIFHSVKGAMGI